MVWIGATGRSLLKPRLACSNGSLSWNWFKVISDIFTSKKKSQNQTRFKVWRNRPYLLMGGTVKYIAKGMSTGRSG